MAMSWSNDALCFSLAGLSALMKNVFTLLNPHTDLPLLGSPSVCVYCKCARSKKSIVLSLNPPIAISSRSLCFCSLWSGGMRHQDAIKLWVRASDPYRWSTSLIVLLNFISICLCVCVPEKINHDMHAEVSMQGGSRISLSVCVSLSDVRKSGWSRRDLWLLPSYTKHCTVTVVFKSSKKTKNVTNKWVRSTVSDVKMSK